MVLKLSCIQACTFVQCTVHSLVLPWQQGCRQGSGCVQVYQGGSVPVLSSCLTIL
jgi:hypothetical protein